MKLTKEEKIYKYHLNEIFYFLYILGSNFKNYSAEELICFEEDMEGRFSSLFDEEYLNKLNFEFSLESIKLIRKLNDCLADLYKSAWLLNVSDKELKMINNYSHLIINELGVKYCEPIAFANSNLLIDW